MAELYTEGQLRMFRDDLESVDAELERLTASGAGPLDHGVLNLPIGKRPGAALTDAKISRYSELTRRRESLLHKLRRPAREAAYAAAKAEREVLAAMDLKARFGSCDEVRWLATGEWYPVVRWSAKSVTVRMEHADERLTASEIASARVAASGEVTP